MSPLIEPEVLATLLSDDKVIVLDARFSLGDPNQGRTLYLQGHIPGARYIDLEQDLSAPAIAGKTGRHPLPQPDVFSATIARLGINQDSHVVVYDDGGHAMAARAWWQLRWIGVEHVQVLHGGWKSWTGARYPVIRELPDVSQTSFVGQANESMTVSAADIVAQLEISDFLLLDARSLERYAGEQEPLDSKAGHIPGALCLPFLENMDDSGLFLSKEQLREKFDAVLDSEKATVSYCGSGVTGCHNLLAMEYAGLKGARLYPGSWSEWVADESRPVATGK